jgi:spermidine synthase
MTTLGQPPTIESFRQPARAGTSVPSPASKPTNFFLFGGAICLGAFLLFQVQLIMAKYILPWFGGTPSVWTSCMLVFQVLLLLGYLYTHVLTTHLPRQLQNSLHLVLLVLSVAVLVWLSFRWKTPITPDVAWKPSPDANPTWRIVELLLVSVAFPFFLLSTTGPLVQKWFARAHPNESPYRLYALSNFGSLLGLLTYPFLIEPGLTIRSQAWVWSAGYLVYAVASALCTRATAGKSDSPEETANGAIVNQPNYWVRFLWVGLAACASVMLLATTNVICQQVAVVPFLWVLPLCMYLGSFILCFESSRWYRRSLFQLLFFVLAGISCWLLLHGPAAPVYLQLATYPALLFVSCMISHGELVHLKPPASHLTHFYLLIALGGAVGGVFTGLVAPHIFANFWEFHTGVIASSAFLLFALAHDRASWWHQAPRWLPAALLSGSAILAIPTMQALTGEMNKELLLGLVAVAAIAGIYALLAMFRRRAGEVAHPIFARATALIALSIVCFALFADANLKPEDVRLRSRNFYGIVSVVRASSVAGPYFYLRNRMTNHGVQFVNPRYANVPTGYYGPDSGVGKLLFTHPRPMRVGLVGLGIGTLAAYGQSGDYFRFYEINPAVVSLASGPGAFFTYVRNSPASSEVVLGDARLCLEREAAAGQRQNFDVLVIDAFSGDAIPTHLLTREAFAVYLQHLRSPESIIALHISNLSLDLAPVVSGLAHEFQLRGVRIHHPEAQSFSAQTDWVLLSRNPARFKTPLIASAAAPLAYDSYMPLWTDDYSNLFRVVRFGSSSKSIAVGQ